MSSLLSKLTVDTFVFDPRPDYPFLLASKRYRPKSNNAISKGLTLVFAHGTGYHKEHWEATIEDLWSAVEQTKGVEIREFWSIDCPNHGDSAVLNEKTLQWGYQDICESHNQYLTLHA